MAALALHHLTTIPQPRAYCAAASREQAALLWRYAATYALHPTLQELVTVRHLELRRKAPNVKDTSSLGGGLKVLASDAPKLHGLAYSLAVVDELAQHRIDEVYLAMRSALHKVPEA